MKKNYVLLLVFVISVIIQQKKLSAQTSCTLTPPSVTGSTYVPCTSSSNFTLTANGSSTNSFGWYANPWGGNAISTNSVFVTPTFTSGTTYYVGTNSGVSTASITLPYFVSGYSGNTRGMYFTAPINFVITGVRVPLDVGGTSNSAIAIMKFPSAPPAYATTTNSFNLLYMDQAITHTNIVAVNIPVFAGDVIGVLGARNNVTSYGPTGTSIGSLGTNTLTLDRLGMQYVLSSTAPQDLWSEVAGSLGRMEIYTTIGCLSTLTPVTVSVSSAPQVLISGPTGSICAGSSYTLNASGVTSYTWVGGPQTSSYVVNPSTQTTYTVMGSISPTCGATSLITVSVNPGVPSLSVIKSSSLICSGNSVSISAGGATTYTITGSAGNVTNNALFYPQSTSNYTVLGQNSCGTTSAVTSISVNPTPTILTSASSTLICDGDPSVLTATGAATYTWSPGLLVGSSVTVTPNAPTAYQVNGLSAAGCPANASQIVIVNPSPTVVATTNKTLVCSGGSATLSGSGATTYSWNTNAQTAVTSVNLNQTTTYTVTGSYTTGCHRDQIVTVNVFVPNLQISPSNSAVACNGSMVTFTANAGPNTNYNWSNGSPFGILSVTAITNTNYIVTATTNSNGVICPSSATVYVSVFPNPTVTATSTRTSICKGEKTTITGGGAVSYTWSTNANTSTIQVAPTSGSPFYNVQGTDANGCVTGATIQITVKSCTGLMEQEQGTEAIQLYPNPNNGEFVVKSDQALDLNLVNELGQVIQKISLSEENSNHCEIKNLPGGIYFVSGYTKDQERIYQKIIILK